MTCDLDVQIGEYSEKTDRNEAANDWIIMPCQRVAH
jgi:hypothetical protein